MSSCASPALSAANGQLSLLELGLGCPGDREKGRGGKVCLGLLGDGSYLDCLFHWFALFRFCGLIQVLVMNPDSSAPTEEADGAREVLEVRLWNWGAGGEPRAKDPAELSWVLTLCALQFDYEYLETGERLVLGKGTYGVVYAGRDRHTRVRIAIKEIPERDSRCAALVHAGPRALEGGHEQVGGT